MKVIFKERLLLLCQQLFIEIKQKVDSIRLLEPILLTH